MVAVGEGRAGRSSRPRPIRWPPELVGGAVRVRSQLSHPDRVERDDEPHREHEVHRRAGPPTGGDVERQAPRPPERGPRRDRRRAGRRRRSTGQRRASRSSAGRSAPAARGSRARRRTPRRPALPARHDPGQRAGDRSRQDTAVSTPSTAATRAATTAAGRVAQAPACASASPHSMTAGMPVSAAASRPRALGRPQGQHGEARRVEGGVDPCGDEAQHGPHERHDGEQRHGERHDPQRATGEEQQTRAQHAQDRQGREPAEDGGDEVERAAGHRGAPHREAQAHDEEGHGIRPSGPADQGPGGRGQPSHDNPSPPTSDAPTSWRNRSCSEVPRVSPATVSSASTRPPATTATRIARGPRRAP